MLSCMSTLESLVPLLIWLSYKFSLSFSEPVSPPANETSRQTWGSSAWPPLIRLIKVVGVPDSGVFFSFSWSPDGTKIASGGESGKVIIWSVESPAPSDWTLIKTIGRHGSGVVAPVKAVAWSPDGTRIASAGDDKKIKVWSVEGNDPATWGLQHKTIGEHELAKVNSMAWSPDSTKLITGGRGKLKVWRMEGWHDSQWGLWMEKYGGLANCVAWSPDGTKVAFAWKSISIWIVQSPKNALKSIFDSQGISFDSLAWSPDGTKIVSGGPWTNLTIFDVSGPDPSRWGMQWKTIGKHDDKSVDSNALSVAWSPDSTKIVSSRSLWEEGDTSGAGSIIVWSVNGSDIWQSGLKSRIISKKGVGGVAWSPDGTKLAAAGCSLQVWSAEDSSDLSQSALIETVGEHDGLIESVAWSPDASQVVTGSKDSKIKFWNVAGSTLAHWGGIKTFWLGDSRVVYDVAWSPDGKRVASADWDSDLKVWNVEGVDPSRWVMMLDHASRAGVAMRNAEKCLAWSPDSKYVVNAESYLSVWNVSGATPSQWRAIKIVWFVDLWGPMHYVTAVAWSPDGTKIVTGHEDRKVKIWSIFGSDPSQWFKLHRTLGEHYDNLRSGVKAVAWSPDGTKIASGSKSDARVCVWRVLGFNSSQRGLMKAFGEHKGYVKAVSWSPDSTKLVTSGTDRKIIVWNLKGSDPSRWALIGTIGTVDDEVFGVAWSPDGTKVVSVGSDKKVKIWSMLVVDSSKRKFIDTNVKEPGNAMTASHFADTAAPFRAYMHYHGYYPKLYASRFNVSVFQSSAVAEGAELLPTIWGSPYWPMFDELNFKGARSLREIVMTHYTSTVSIEGRGLYDMVSNLQLLWARTAPVYIGRLDASRTSLFGPLSFRPPEGLKFLDLRHTMLESVELQAWLNLSEGLDLRFSKLDNQSLSCTSCIWRSGVPRCAENRTGFDFNSVFCRGCKPGWYMPDAHSPCHKCVPWEWGLEFVGAILACGLACYFVSESCRQRFSILIPRAQRLELHALYLRNKVFSAIIGYQVISTLRQLRHPLPKIAKDISDSALFFQFKWITTSHVAACWLENGFYATYSLRIAELLVMLIVACTFQHITGKKSKVWCVAQIVKFTSVSVASDSMAMFQCDDRLKRLAYIAVAPQDRKSFLRVDYTVICETNLHVFMQVVATIVMSVWCFLLPGIALWLLLMHKEEGGSSGSQGEAGSRRLARELSFLYDGNYIDRSWWFFLLSFFVKPVISFAYAFNGNSMEQSIYGAWAAFAYACNACLISPYKLRSDTFMEACAFFCVSSSFVLAGLQTESSDVMLAVVMCIPASALLVLAIGSVWHVPVSEFQQLLVGNGVEHLLKLERDSDASSNSWRQPSAWSSS